MAEHEASNGGDKPLDRAAIRQALRNEETRGGMVERLVNLVRSQPKVPLDDPHVKAVGFDRDQAAYAIYRDVWSDGPLSVVKGTVDILGDEGSADLCLVAWPTFDSGPDYGKNGKAIHTSSFDVFTEREVLDLINQRDPSLLRTAGTVDELLADEMANKEVVALLGAALIARSLEKTLTFLERV